MFGSHRLDKEFRIIRSTTYVPCRQLATALDISERTVRGDLSKINGVLAQNGAKITMRRGVGYRLVIRDPQAFDAFERESRTSPGITLETPSERMGMLLKTLFSVTGFIQKEALARCVYVEESTLENYLHHVREAIERFGIQYVSKRGQGIRLVGDEDGMRACFLSEIVPHDRRPSVREFTAYEESLFDKVDLTSLTQILNAHMGKCAVHMSDRSFRDTLLCCALMIQRMRDGFERNASSDAMFVSPEATSLAADLARSLSSALGLYLPTGERQYLAQSIERNTTSKTPRADFEQIGRTVDRLLLFVKKSYGFDFTNDRPLIESLTSHLSSVFRDRCNHMRQKNPLLSTIKHDFPLAFEIAFTSVNEVLGSVIPPLSEDEMGYVALHVGASLEAYTSQLQGQRRTVVVCDSGKAAASMLNSRIKTFFGTRLSVKLVCSYHEWLSVRGDAEERFEMAVSTVELEGCSIPCALVTFGLSGSDIQTLSRVLKTMDDNVSKQVRSFFHERCFLRVGDRVEKDELLERLCGRLRGVGDADERLLDSVMQREGLSDTSMNGLFAIPHPMCPRASQTQVAVAVLRHPLRWSDAATKVGLVFLLVIKPGDWYGMEHLYDLLVKVTRDKELCRRLIGSDSYRSFVETLL